MTRVLLLTLFVVAAIAAPRPAPDSAFPVLVQGRTGAPQPAIGVEVPRLSVSPVRSVTSAALFPSVASQPTNASANVSVTGYTGNAGWAVASLGASYLAVRLPRGTLVTVCGPGDCWTTRTTDYGPSSRIRPARVADIAVGQWQRVCGLSPSRGLCCVTILVGGLPIAPATDVGGTP